MRARGLVRNSVPGNGLNGIRLNLHGHVANEIRECARMRGRVVDAVEHHVLEGDEVAWRVREIAAARGEQLGERIFAVDGHEPIAQRVVGCVQRDGERDRARRARRSIAGTRPEVDSVTRRRDSP